MNERKREMPLEIGGLNAVRAAGRPRNGSRHWLPDGTQTDFEPTAATSKAHARESDMMMSFSAYRVNNDMSPPMNVFGCFRCRYCHMQSACSLVSWSLLFYRPIAVRTTKESNGDNADHTSGDAVSVRSIRVGGRALISHTSRYFRSVGSHYCSHELKKEKQ